MLNIRQQLLRLPLLLELTGTFGKRAGDAAVVVMSFSCSHISSVPKAPVRTFSSNMRGSRKHVTEPMFRRCSLQVNCMMSLVGVLSSLAPDVAAGSSGCLSRPPRSMLLLRRICCRRSLIELPD